MGGREPPCERCHIRPRIEASRLCALCPPKYGRTPNALTIAQRANQRIVVRWINSPSPTKQLNFRWPANVCRAIGQIAAAKGMSLNAYLQSVARIAIGEYAYENPEYEPNQEAPCEADEEGQGGSTQD